MKLAMKLEILQRENEENHNISSPKSPRTYQSKNWKPQTNFPLSACYPKNRVRGTIIRKPQKTRKFYGILNPSPKVETFYSDIAK